MKVGFIGIGRMGRHMSRHLIDAGYDLVVYDVVREAAHDQLAKGATWADTPKEIADSVDVLFTSLPGPSEVEAVVLGKDGVLDGAHDRLIYFDLSTNSHSLQLKLHSELARHGVTMMDSPVSGGPRTAAAKELTQFVGGDANVFEQYRDMLESFVARSVYVGPFGSGTVVKLTLNCYSYTVQAVLAETFTLGVRAGVAPVRLFEALRASAPGRRRPFDGLLDHFLPANYEPPDFTVRLAQKDLALAATLALELDVPMRMANMALQEMTEAIGRGWEDLDSRGAMMLQSQRAHVEVNLSQEELEGLLDD